MEIWGFSVIYEEYQVSVSWEGYMLYYDIFISL